MRNLIFYSVGSKTGKKGKKGGLPQLTDRSRTQDDYQTHKGGGPTTEYVVKILHTISFISVPCPS
jgi:hypothetical protein